MSNTLDRAGRFIPHPRIDSKAGGVLKLPRTAHNTVFVSVFETVRKEDRVARLGGGGAAKAPKPPKAAKAGAPVRVVKTKPSGGAFIGLDIGSQMIKAVEVKGAGPALTVTALASINTPPGVIQNGLVADPKTLGAAIKQLLSKTASNRAKS